jgi:hypothetical protein
MLRNVEEWQRGFKQADWGCIGSGYTTTVLIGPGATPYHTILGSVFSEIISLNEYEYLSVKMTVFNKPNIYIMYLLGSQNMRRATPAPVDGRHPRCNARNDGQPCAMLHDKCVIIHLFLFHLQCPLHLMNTWVCNSIMVRNGRNNWLKAYRATEHRAIHRIILFAVKLEWIPYGNTGTEVKLDITISRVCSLTEKILQMYMFCRNYVNQILIIWNDVPVVKWKKN